jgi:hypothetical protein
MDGSLGTHASGSPVRRSSRAPPALRLVRALARRHGSGSAMWAVQAPRSPAWRGGGIPVWEQSGVVKNEDRRNDAANDGIVRIERIVDPYGPLPLAVLDLPDARFRRFGFSPGHPRKLHVVWHASWEKTASVSCPGRRVGGQGAVRTSTPRWLRLSAELQAGRPRS